MIYNVQSFLSCTFPLGIRSQQLAGTKMEHYLPASFIITHLRKMPQNYGLIMPLLSILVNTTVWLIIVGAQSTERFISHLIRIGANGPNGACVPKHVAAGSKNDIDVKKHNHNPVQMIVLQLIRKLAGAELNHVRGRNGPVVVRLVVLDKCTSTVRGMN